MYINHDSSEKNMENFRRVGRISNTQIEILEQKKIQYQLLKIQQKGFERRSDGVEDRIGKQEYRSIENIQIEAQRKKYEEENKRSVTH